MVDPTRPARDWVLGDEGRQRCEALAGALASQPIDRLFSSDEPKAIETSQLLAQRLGLEHTCVPGLHEHERHSTPYLGEDAFRAAMQRFFACPDALVYGQETADAAHVRFAQALGQAMAGHTGQTVAIVAHGTVISLLVSRANPTLTGGFELWQRLGLPSFVVLTWPDLILERVVEAIG